MHGGTIRSGVLSTSSVFGVYWINWMSSFSKITDPGVTARLPPTSNAASSTRVMRLLNVIDEVLHTGNQTSGTALDGRSDHGRIGKRKVRWTHRINELPGKKSKLKLRFFIDLSLLDEII